MTSSYPEKTNAVGGTHATRALSDDKSGQELLRETVPEFRSGDWRLLSYEVIEVRKQRKKRIIFGRMRYRDGPDDRTRTDEIVAKIYGSDRGRKALGALGLLWKAGFRPPAGYRVARPYGYSPGYGTLFQARAPGTTWDTLLRENHQTLDRASAQAAGWIIRLQNSPVSAEARRWEGDVDSAQRFARELGSAFPRHATHLEQIAGRLAQSLRSEGMSLVPSHGDYHPKNVFLTPEVTTVIDFDTFALRDAAFDVGYAIGQLLIMSYLRMEDLSPGASAALAFWRHYERDGRAPWARVARQVARTFLQSLHYELCTLRNGRVELLDLWAALMETWLNSDGQEILEDLVRRS